MGVVLKKCFVFFFFLHGLPVWGPSMVNFCGYSSSCGKKGLFMQLQFPWQKYSSIDCIIGGKGRFIIYGGGWASKNGGGGMINPGDSKRGHHEIQQQMCGATLFVV